MNQDQIDRIAAALAAAVWVVAGTPASAPYPCRCSERRFRECSAVFCPCSGRIDPPSAECCAAVVNTPERAAQAAGAYQRARIAGTA